MRRLLGDRGAGQELVELALVLPVLLLIVLAIIEFAVVSYSYNTIANAAREGARRGVVLTGTDDEIIATVEAVVLDRAVALDLVAHNVTVTLPPSNTVRVEVNYTVTLMTEPIIRVMGSNPNVVLNTVATMYRE